MSDLIKREDAIKALCDSCGWKESQCEQDEGFWCESGALIRRDIPSADRPQGWIPCSERLPEEKESVYLICTDNGYLCSCRWTQDIYGLGAADEWSTWGWNHADVPQFSKVVAWMDLKPWKGADDER